MSTKITNSKSSYIRHSAEYKQESLKLASQVGVAKAAKQLGLHESQLYAWRKQSEHTINVSEREVNLATENARLKRQLAQQAEELSILKNAATYPSTSSGQASLNNSSEVRIHETTSS